MRVPGIFAANRQNYAQDLQISSRGFGARAAFGVRGVRLYQDDIPATMPDGQGQTGSFSLLSARAHRGAARAVLDALRQRFGRRHLGVHRDPAPAPPVLDASRARAATARNAGRQGRRARRARSGYVVAANRFDTDGYRDHSAARRGARQSRSSRSRWRERHAAHRARQLAAPAAIRRTRWGSRGRSGTPIRARPIPWRRCSTRARPINQYAGRRRRRPRVRRDTTLARRPDMAGIATIEPVPRALAASGRRPPAASSTSTATTAASARSCITARALVRRPLTLDRGRRLRPAEGAPRGLRQRRRRAGASCAATRTTRSAATDVYAQLDGAPCRALARRPACARATCDFDSDDHYVDRRQSGRQRIAHVPQHEPMLGPRVARERHAQRVRELRPRLRDADLRRARLPARRHRAQPRPRRRRRAAAVEIGVKAIRSPAPPRQRRGCSRSTPTTRSSSTRDRRPHDVSQRRQDAAARLRGRLGRRPWRRASRAHANYTYLEPSSPTRSRPARRR